MSDSQSVSSSAEVAAAEVTAAKALGWQATVCDGKMNQGDAYDTCVRQGLATHPSAISLQGIDCDQATAPLQQAKSEGIPVIASVGIDCNNKLTTTPGPSLFTGELVMDKAASNFADWEYARGEAEARYIIQATHGHAQVIEEALLEALAGRYLNNGLLAGLKQCSGCKVVDHVVVTSDDLASGTDAQMMASAAVQYPSANVIAYGFSSFVQSSKLEEVADSMHDHPLVIGGEGEIANLQLIGQGASAPTVEAAYSNGWLGYGVIDELVRIFDHKPTVPEGIGWQFVAKGHNVPPSGQPYDGPIDYASDYLKAWGVQK